MSTVVVKVGGSVLEPQPAPELIAALARTAAAAGAPGLRPAAPGGRSPLLAPGQSPTRLVVVHGGGKALSGLLARLQIESRFDRGLRVTTPETLTAAVMAFAGQVNTMLVAALEAAGMRCCGLTGLDGSTVVARAEQPELGAVGTPCGGDARLLEALLEAGVTPVLAPLASDGRGGVLNVNADSFAAACAAQLLLGAGPRAASPPVPLRRVERLLFVTDVAGVLDASGAVMPRVSLSELDAMAASGAIKDGMLPKSAACRTALAAGVRQVAVIGPQAAFAIDRLLTRPTTEPVAGTQVVA